MRRPSSRQFSHAQVAGKDLFDCGRASSKPVREAACEEKSFITEKLKYDLRMVCQRSPGPAFIIKRNIIPVEALAPMSACRAANGSFFGNSTKFARCHLVPVAVQKEKFHHVYLFFLVHFDRITVLSDLLIK
jgi:hypothetical protein